MTQAMLSVAELTIPLDERTTLRPVEDADADELYAVTDANRAYLAPWMPWAAGQTPERVREFIRRTRAELDRNLAFTLTIVQDGRALGTVGFHRLDWENRSTSIGYWIAEAAQGQGTITRAVSALLDRAFGAWGLNRVEIRAAVENHRSRAVAARLGFREEGILRQAERIGDGYLDQVLYAMLATDWAKPLSS